MQDPFVQLPVSGVLPKLSLLSCLVASSACADQFPASFTLIRDPFVTRDPPVGPASRSTLPVPPAAAPGRLPVPAASRNKGNTAPLRYSRRMGNGRPWLLFMIEKVHPGGIIRRARDNHFERHVSRDCAFVKRDNLILEDRTRRTR